MNDLSTTIPKGWKMTTLGEVVEIIDGDRGINYPKDRDFHQEGFCLFLNTKNVPDTKFIFNQKQFITKEKSAALRKGKLMRGDFVLTTRGTVGNFACFSEQIPFDHIRINSGMVLLRANEEFIDRCFLGSFLSSSAFRRQVIELSSGTAQPQLPIRDLTRFEILLPPLPTQRSIASILSSFDDKIELLCEENKTLEAIAQGIFKEWFVKFKFPGATGKMVESEMGMVPEGWRVGKLEEVIDIRGGTTPSTKSPEYWNGNIAWTSPKDLSNSKELFLFKTEKSITTLGLRQISSGLLPKGTLLLSSRAPIGYLAFSGIEVAINQGYIALLPNQYFSNYFMYLWLKSNMDSVIGSANGSTFLEISKSSFKCISCVVPEESTLKTFEELISPFFEKMRANILQTQTLSTLRDVLLPKLMRGEIETTL